MEEQQWSELGVDVRRPSAARVHDYLLGGDCNFEADRLLARQVLEAMPDAARLARANRDFQRRAIELLVAEGVNQFLDIGSGIPTAHGSVHECARRHDPLARVAYVDVDPVAVEHGSVLLAGDDRAVIVRGDVCAPTAILRDPVVCRTIDFARPVGVLLLAVLHFVSDAGQARAIIDQLARRVAPGSFFVLSHLVPETPRSFTQLGEIMVGLEPVDPGVVHLRAWRPDPSADEGEPVQDELVVGVWRRPPASDALASADEAGAFGRGEQWRGLDGGDLAQRADCGGKKRVERV